MTTTAVHRTVRQLVGFGLIGGASALIDFGVFYLLTTVGVIPEIATVISFLAAFAVNYQGNKKLVFRARHSKGALRRYIVLVAANLILSTGVVAAGVALGLLPIAAKIISMVIVAIVNFMAMRFWVFRVRSSADGAATASHDAESTASN